MLKNWPKAYTYKHSFCNTSCDIHQCWNIINVHKKKTWLTIKFIISCLFAIIPKTTHLGYPIHQYLAHLTMFVTNPMPSFQSMCTW
jgi:hypothetical protein